MLLFCLFSEFLDNLHDDTAQAHTVTRMEWFLSTLTNFSP